MKRIERIQGTIVDVQHKRMFKGSIHIKDKKIVSVEEHDCEESHYILPGFIDAHVHIESSMLTPVEFARQAVQHGTVATVSDPHEIANVCGLQGIDYMIENAKSAFLKIYFGAPSCVPATSFETAGANLGIEETKALLKRNDIHYLSEMMNFPAVIANHPEVMAKINLAHRYQKKVDGHAPGVRGEKAKKYIEAGISTDHECVHLDEALEKIRYGMKIIIREGSAAKNFEALHTLIDTHTNDCMLCSDDKHPDDFIEGHIDSLVKRALNKGFDLYKVLQVACINPVHHYRLNNGLLQVGDAADFIVVNNLKDFNILQTVINAQVLYENKKCFIPSVSSSTINNFYDNKISPEKIKVDVKGSTIRVIEAIDGQLITNETSATVFSENNNAISDTKNDILKMVLINRYAESEASIAFIKNFGLKKGAIASTVAHDSHNIIALGCSDKEICEAINLLIESKGGLSYFDFEQAEVQSLPVAGLMSTETCAEVALRYKQLNQLCVNAGCKLKAPYMTLSFMALLVIPSLKLSDKGLFDGNRFSFTSLFTDEN
ncbi:MAG TPA: adenine deaminase [Bacteroidia bacterium]|nr:adenine deaminase [Bacteroidia bacterium]HNT80669.1 adenine deaminase [Bacteroidia bacterium]